MHSYLRAIGFSKITKSELKGILSEAGKHPDGYEVTIDDEGNEYAELRFEIAEGIGLVMRGTYNERDEFLVDYYFPYFESRLITTFGKTEIIKLSDREGYQGLTEDNRLGIDLIYHIQNMIGVIRSNLPVDTFMDINGVCLSGLATEGKVLLPLAMTKSQRDRKKELVAERIQLIEAAKEGDQEAYEKLSLGDLDTYTDINQRIASEDILTIVSSTFMPSGIESDKYAIIGEIMSFTKVKNELTMEELYIMHVDCNDMEFELCINAKDLYGEPMVGRRFKGTVWLQGKIEVA